MGAYTKLRSKLQWGYGWWTDNVVSEEIIFDQSIYLIRQGEKLRMTIRRPDRCPHASWKSVCMFICILRSLTSI